MTAGDGEAARDAAWLHDMLNRCTPEQLIRFFEVVVPKARETVPDMPEPPKLSFAPIVRP